jgi:hypothetical protein
MQIAIRALRCLTAPVLLASVLVARAMPETLTMAEPQPLSEGAEIKIGSRAYALRFLENATIGNVEKSNKVCLWRDGTVWVIDPLHPDLMDHFACRWPIVTFADDRSLAVVQLPDKKELLLGVADLKKRTLLAQFADEKYIGGSGRWVFSMKSRHVYALDGAAVGGWHYFDLVKNECVHLKLPGFRPRQNIYNWNGTLLGGGNQVVLLLSGGLQSDPKRRLQLPLDDLDRRTVAVPETDFLLPIVPTAEDRVIAHLRGGKYAMVSTRTWKVMKELAWGSERSIPSTLVPGPGGRHGYLVSFSDGLVIYEAGTGRLAKSFPDATRTVVVTFTADGRHGIACTEKSEIVVFDTTSWRVMVRVPVKRPALLAFLIEPAGKDGVATCLIVPPAAPSERSG